ncbi:MAG: hypothetical protein ACJ79S_10970 [Gemmatimonadaceae bacterium]
MSPVRFWRQWREEQARRRRASVYVATLVREPAEDDVAWLAQFDGARDLDHASWELRHARRSLGLLVAERDALDDRTASDVGRALATALRYDPRIASDKRSVAEQQLNARLAAYAGVLRARTGAEATALRLGRVLLTFTAASDSALFPAEALGHAGELLSRYLLEANGALREAFGAASLPEDVPPSAAAGAPAI